MARGLLVPFELNTERRMKKGIQSALFAGVLPAGFAFALEVSAQCQVCTLVVGAGVGFSRWLGIDDAVSGLWVGGLMASLVLGTLIWMEGKGLRFKGDGIVVAVLFYLSVLGPFYFLGVIGQCASKLWGIDKLIIGIFAGSILFLIGALWYARIKRRRGHAYFPFRKVLCRSRR